MDRWGLGRGKENKVERDRHQSGLIKRYTEIKVDIQRIEWDEENGFERYGREFGFLKRYKEIEVDRQEVETNIGGYVKNRQRDKKR